MNILVMVHDMIVPNMGGGAPRTEAVAKAFRRAGHNVFVMAPFGTEREEAEKELGCRVVPTYHVDRNDKRKQLKHAIYNPILALKTIFFAKRNSIDMIYAHDSIYGSPAMFASKTLNIPFVFDATDLISEYVKSGKGKKYVYKILSLGEKLVVKNATKIVTVSKTMKSILEKTGAKKVEVVYDGVDFDVFHPCKPKYKKKGRFVFIYQGGMDPQDGLEIIVPAAAKVVNELKGAEFWMVGDGKVLPELKKAVKEKNLEKYFRFTGWVPFKEVTQYISDSDVGLVILPNILSARIRVTLKIFEYWACNKPIIVSRLTALEEVVSNETGFFYEPGNPDDLAKKMIEIAKNKNAYAKLSENGSKEVRKYNWNDLGEEIAKISLNKTGL